MKFYRINNKINSPIVRLIDENDKHIGELKIDKALQLAQEKGLDLVEISPKANPPVVKIMDFGQFRYTIKKEERQSKKQKKIGVVKGVRLTPRIGQHDMEIRVKKTQDFLSQGYKVRIEMILKGREKAHFDLAEEKIKKFINILGEAAQIEQEPKRQGNCLTSIISPLSK